MNERIRQLAEQARKYARDYVADCKHYRHYMEHNDLEVKFEEKFAELIVKECAEVASKVVVEHEGVDFGLVEKCYEHFGVAE